MLAFEVEDQSLDALPLQAQVPACRAGIALSAPAKNRFSRTLLTVYLQELQFDIMMPI